MSKLRHVIRYLCSHYPHLSELSNARLTKMVYLADWESSRMTGKQITDIEWYFNNYGPFVDDVRLEAEHDTAIEVVHTNTMFGTPKVQIRLINPNVEIRLQKSEMEILNKIIESTKDKFWNAFIRYVYDTYPVKNSPRYTSLDLPLLAVQEKNGVYKTDT